jgi:cell division protein FtsN
VRLAPTPARLLSGLEAQPAPASCERETPGADRVSERYGAGGAVIQAGSFREEENAGDMVRELKNKGFEARIMAALIRDVRYYRVVVGSRQSQAQAQATLVRLKEAGFEGALILPD